MKPGDIAAGKSCGDCGLCCKLIGVESIAKPQFTWCRHFKKTAGCGIYEDRPHDCRAFICYWLHVPNLGEEWRPDRTGFVMHIADGGARLNIEVDPINPQAWKAEPFYSTFKSWAAKGNSRGLVLLVWVGRRCFEITPGADIDRGMLRATSRQRGKAAKTPPPVQGSR
jgi:hypothetical protein